jgi:hypothetical protein
LVLFKAIGALARIAAIDGLMANGAHRNIRRRELRQVTTSAVFVAGKLGRTNYPSDDDVVTSEACFELVCRNSNSPIIVCDSEKPAHTTSIAIEM